MTQNKYDKFFHISGVMIISFFCFFGVILAGTILTASSILHLTPSSIILNKEDSPLQIGDIWTVEEEFSVWIDTIEEISGETAKDFYPAITDTVGKRFFDVTFSFKNISFSGCKNANGQLDDNLSIKTYVLALDANEEPIWPNVAKGYYKEHYSTSLQNGVEIPVTSGIIAENNHLIVEINSTSETTVQPKFFSITFVVPVEILTAEASVQYKQKYYFLIL